MYGPTLTPEEEATLSQSKQPAYYGAIVTFLVVNNASIIARVWINLKHHFRTRGILTEDIFMLLSAVIYNAILGNLLAGTRTGLGLHVYAINAKDPNWPANLAKSVEYIWITMVLMSGLFATVKLGLLFFYRRLFLVTNRWLKIAWWANVVYVILWFLGATGYYIFQCWPVSWYWMRYYPKYHRPTPGGVVGQCNSTSVVHVAVPMILNLISDIAVLLLPVSVILKLRINNQKRAGLLAIFCIGLAACVIELARILDLTLDTSDSVDLTYGATNFLLLTAAEETAAVVCACLPVIGSAMFKSLKKDSTAGNSGGSYERKKRTMGRSWRRSQDPRGFLLSDRIEGSSSTDAKHDWPIAYPTSISKGDTSLETDNSVGSVHLSDSGRNNPAYGSHLAEHDIHVLTDIQVDIDARHE